MNARKPSSRARKRPAPEPKAGGFAGFFTSMFQDLFAHGVAMPVLLFGVSTVISVGGTWAWFEAAKYAGDLAPLYKFAAALTFFAQWISNCCIMRIRRQRNFGFVVVYLMAACLSGYGVYHMQDVARSASYKLEFQASEEARRPYNTTITENTAVISRAQNEILAINQAGREQHWPGERVQRQAEPTQAVIVSATAAINAAHTQLEALGPQMSPSRPRDWLDILFAIASALTVLLEGVGYFNMTAKGEGAAVKKKPAREKRLSLREVLAMWLARQLLAPATAAALLQARAPEFVQTAPVVQPAPEPSPVAPVMPQIADPTHTAEVIPIQTRREAAAAMGKRSGEVRRQRAAARKGLNAANDAAAAS